MRLHLVDGTYELFRAYYSQRPDHTTPDGRPAKGVVGVVSSMLSLLHDEEEAVTHIAVAFDNPIRSFRNDLFADYKDEGGMDPALRSQFDAVEEGVRALGVAVWSMREYEADDALASGAAQFKHAAEQVRILTPDKDLGQCLDGDRVVQIDRRQKKLITEATFRQQRGFGPKSMPDFLALTGDTADGIPGLAGFGEKGAGLLLGHYEHLEAIPAAAEAWAVKPRGAPALAATLAAHQQEAYLYRKLATLVNDVPLPHTFAELEFRGVPRQGFELWCHSLGVSTLRTVPKRWAD